MIVQCFVLSQFNGLDLNLDLIWRHERDQPIRAICKFYFDQSPSSFESRPFNSDVDSTAAKINELRKKVFLSPFSMASIQ